MELSRQHQLTLGREALLRPHRLLILKMKRISCYASFDGHDVTARPLPSFSYSCLYVNVKLTLVLFEIKFDEKNTIVNRQIEAKKRMPELASSPNDNQVFVCQCSVGGRQKNPRRMDSSYFLFGSQ